MSRGHNDDVYMRELSPTSKTRLPPGDTALYNNHTMSGDGEKVRPGLSHRTSKNCMPKLDGGTSRLRAPKPKSASSCDLPPEQLKRIDYVIVVDNKSVDECTSKKDLSKTEKCLKLREQFRDELETVEGIEVQEEVLGEQTYWSLHVPFSRLCKEAQRVKLQMPLEGCEIYEDEENKSCGCYHDFEEKHFVTDTDIDFISAPFEKNKLWIYENNDNADKFFRPALRCFLTHHILINMDMRPEKEEDDEPMSKKGLLYLLHKKVLKDAFILHDETKEDPAEKEEVDNLKAKHGANVDIENPDEIDADLQMDDTRKELMVTWGKLVPSRYQPMWKIRNYFGEKIALYFAWSGTLISTLWIPTFFGLGVFIYGLYLSISKTLAKNAAQQTLPNSTFVDTIVNIVDDSLGAIKDSFDNAITPYYALVICLWGTVFLEVWKRKNATLAYEWDVDSFEDNEVDRPQFVGTHTKPDPIIIGEQTWYYPTHRYCVKFTTSFAMLIFMILIVFVAAASVILYRVVMTVNYCSNLSSVMCLVVTTVASSVLNAIIIITLGKVYDMIAFKLTEWENHRTQTQYDDALIIKLFAFQFANSYTSLFYIAFFRGDIFNTGIFGLGPQYTDSCGKSTCMAMLSFQVLVLMLLKPFPKFLKDIVIPWLKSLWRKRKCCRGKNSVHDDSKVQMLHFLERERLKPELGDFTLGEYTEKVIVYGFLMLFAASFPLAPLIAMLLNLIDIRVDARRMLWWYRRPVSRIAQDIGMWYGILQFLNFVGVVSNAFLIAFTSEWGSTYSTMGKLWIVIIFEPARKLDYVIAAVSDENLARVRENAHQHIVFVVKYLLAVFIPDVPAPIRLEQRRHIVFGVKFILAAFIPDIPNEVVLSMHREKYQVQKILEKAANAVDAHKKPSAKHLLNRRDTMETVEEMGETGDETRLINRRNKGKKKGDGGQGNRDSDGKRKPPTLKPLRKRNSLGSEDADDLTRHHSSLQSPRSLEPLRASRLLPVNENRDQPHWDTPRLSYDANGDTHFSEEPTPRLYPKLPRTTTDPNTGYLRLGTPAESTDEDSIC